MKSRNSCRSKVLRDEITHPHFLQQVCHYENLVHFGSIDAIYAAVQGAVVISAARDEYIYSRKKGTPY
jgi:hypothetical protein